MAAHQSSLEKELAETRGMIDDLDSKILSLLQERAALAIRAGVSKLNMNADVWHPGRERQVFDRISSMNRMTSTLNEFGAKL